MPANRSGKSRSLLKKEFKNKLAQGYGIAEACKQLRFARATYYNWRNADEAFASEVDLILADPIHQTRLLRHDGKAAAQTFSTWQKKFVALYRQTGSRDEAIAGCGKSALEVEAALNPKSEDFDAVFARLFDEEQQRRLWRIEDNLLKKAEHDTTASRFVLSNLLKDRYGKVGGETTVNAQLNWFTEAGANKAQGTLEQLFGSHPPVREIAAPHA